MVITSLQIGGAETQVVNLAQKLRSRNWEVAVVSMLGGGHTATLASAGIPLHMLEMKRGMPDPRAALRLARIIRSFRPDVVHSHMVHANILARCTRLIVSMPALICTAHNTRETSERGGPTWYKEVLYGITERLADHTTIICRAGWNHYVASGAALADRLEIIPNGIDCRRFAPNPQIRTAMRAELGLVHDEFVWLAAARLVPQKDFPNLFRALALLSGGKWKLLIAGDGQLRQELEALVQQLGIARQVRFLGVRKDIPSLHNAADAFVLSSELEGLPLAALEASASGLPCVVTDVGGASEAVVHGATGYVVPPKDPVALSRAMNQLMSLSPEKQLELARAARAHCTNHFEIEAIVSRWESVYARYMRPQQPLPKIAYVITRAERGGAQIHVRDLLAHAPGECEPILLTGEKGYLCEWAAKHGIPTTVIPGLRQPISPLQDLRALVHLIRFFHSESPALVHAHTSKAGLLCRLAGALTRTPVVFTAHTWSFAEGIPHLQRMISLPLERLAARCSGKVIAVSQANAETALKHSVAEPSDLVTIWNGMPDTNLRATPGDNSELTIVMVARFAPQKDHASLLQALARIRVHTPWRLLAVGDGPTRQETEQLATDLGLRDRVEFMGDRCDSAEILARSDLFVLSTNWEGLPLSILEAMRAGLPVIATDVGGCAEAVTHGVTGFLTRKSDIADLMERLQTLLSSRELLASMGAAGRTRFERDFRVEQMVIRTWDVYRSEAPELQFTASLLRLQAQLESLNGVSVQEQPSTAGRLS